MLFWTWKLYQIRSKLKNPKNHYDVICQLPHKTSSTLKILRHPENFLNNLNFQNFFKTRLDDARWQHPVVGIFTALTKKKALECFSRNHNCLHLLLFVSQWIKTREKTEGNVTQSCWNTQQLWSITKKTLESKELQLMSLSNRWIIISRC